MFGKLSEDINCGCRCKAMHNLILNWLLALEMLPLLMPLLPKTLPSPHKDKTDNLYVVFVACNWQLFDCLMAFARTASTVELLLCLR